MRRVTVTLFLAATAGAAAFVAPRLVGVADVEQPGCELPIPVEPAIEVEPVSVVEPVRVVEPVHVIERVVQRVIAPIPSPGPTTTHPVELIPELDAPVAVPRQRPEPVPVDFWPDMVDCGMG